MTEHESDTAIRSLEKRTGVQALTLADRTKTMRVLQCVADDPALIAKVAALECVGVMVFAGGSFDARGGIVNDIGGNLILDQDATAADLRAFLLSR